MAVLVVDSGVGGLTVLREVRTVMPTQQIIYVGDDAGFPYGGWSEEALVERLVGLFKHYLSLHDITLGVVACNTASTLIMPTLREAFDIPFVGTAPAIKPAAERTQSGLVSVLATPGTLSRRYTKGLIEQFASDVEMNLVASSVLAEIAEKYMQHREIDTEALWQEIKPCFVSWGGKQTDIVVLGCTHYPFLVNEMRKIAPWPVDWIDPAEAIAIHALNVLREANPQAAVEGGGGTETDLAYLTSNQVNPAAQRLLQGFGLAIQAHGPLQLRALT